jgi:hypothetical protein
MDEGLQIQEETDDSAQHRSAQFDPTEEKSAD